MFDRCDIFAATSFHSCGALRRNASWPRTGKSDLERFSARPRNSACAPGIENAMAQPHQTVPTITLRAQPLTRRPRATPVRSAQTTFTAGLRRGRAKFRRYFPKGFAIRSMKTGYRVLHRPRAEQAPQLAPPTQQRSQRRRRARKASVGGARDTYAGCVRGYGTLRNEPRKL